MPKPILRCNYLKNAPPSHLKNFVTYIGTREGVEKVESTTAHLPPTARQEDLIQDILNKIPDADRMHEYYDYIQRPTRENASEFITQALENNLDIIAKKKNYMYYLANGPGVEKVGKHGLFSNEGESIVLSRVADEVANHMGDVPVLCAGRVDDPDMALVSIENGDCDIVNLGRPLLADPDYVNKLRAGRRDEICPCISCQEGCMGRLQQYSMINCAVNPQAARERFTAYEPVLKPKKVMIVGGGVAGCEAARVLAIRGHKPELFEKNSVLGGNLLPGGAPEFKEDDIALAHWFALQMEKLGVPVHLNKEISKEDVISGGYDTVVIATGSTPKRFPLGDDERVYTAEQVLLKEKDCGNSVVVVGGGLVGCETALWLAQHKKKVFNVEALDKLPAMNGSLCSANKDMLERLIPYNGIEVMTGAKVSGYREGVLSMQTAEREKQIPCDSVVLSVGY